MNKIQPPNLPKANVIVPIDWNRSVALSFSPNSYLRLNQRYEATQRQNGVVLSAPDGTNYLLGGHGGGGGETKPPFNLPNSSGGTEVWRVTSWEITPGTSWDYLRNQGGLGNHTEGEFSANIQFTCDNPEGHIISSGALLVSVDFLMVPTYPAVQLTSPNPDNAIATSIPSFGALKLVCSTQFVRRYYFLCITRTDTRTSTALVSYTIGDAPENLSLLYVNDGPSDLEIRLSGWEAEEGASTEPLANQANVTGVSATLNGGVSFQVVSALTDEFVSSGTPLMSVNYTIVS